MFFICYHVRVVDKKTINNENAGDDGDDDEVRTFVCISYFCEGLHYVYSTIGTYLSL